MKFDLRVRFLVIAIVVGFLGWHAWRAVAREELELGIDLRGGSELVFRFDFRDEASGNRAALLSTSIAIIQDRIDRYGLKEIQVQPIGDDRFAVQVSAKERGSVDALKSLITVLGNLEFRITVESNDPSYDAYKQRFAAALEAGADLEKARVVPPDQRTQEDINAGRYPDGLKWYRLSERRIGRYGLTHHENWVLCRLDPHNVSGQDLTNVHHYLDTEDTLRTGWAVGFGVKKFAQARMAGLTSAVGSHMAIILNDRVDSAPVLNSQLSSGGRIEGNFTEEEAKALAAVLQAGALEHKPELISENTIASDLAGSARRTGVLSTILAFSLVLVFMVWFYKWPGMLANLALLLNLVLLLGVLNWFGAVLTLPGLAGVVLTVGMAVDANILVFERIKEERAKGRTVAQALAAGYDRALVTIVDANLTTLITAYFLYQIGSGPVRGFGVTLAVGIVISMFTALYVTRTIFAWLLRRGRLGEMRMRGDFRPPSFPWMSWLRKSSVASLVLVLGGAVLFLVVPEKRKYDLEFTQGSKLVMRLFRTMRLDEVRARLARLGDDEPKYRDFAVRVSAEGLGASIAEDEGVGFEIRSQDVATRDEIDALAAALRASFADAILPGPFEATLRAAPPESSAGLEGVLYFTNPQVSAAHVRHALLRYEQLRPGTLARPRADALPGVPGAPAVVQVRFANPLRERDDVAIYVRDALAQYDHAAILRALEERSKAESTPAEERATAAKDLETLRTAPVDDPAAFFAEANPFPLKDRIDPFTAELHRSQAIRAILASIAGIILYVAFRFRSWSFGFASVITLVHDVVATLGVAALFSWLGIVDARLNLVMVAAYLTLIGYSINDTIVVFDRVREHRGGQARARLAEIIDLSVNETLARSIRTSFTVFIVVLVLLVMNHGVNAALEGFGFVLTFGVIVGSYSSIFIAAPLLMFLPWMWRRCGGTVRSFFRRAGIYWACAAPALLGVDALRGAFSVPDPSRAVFADVVFGLPLGVSALFLYDFVCWLRLDARERELAAAA